MKIYRTGDVAELSGLSPSQVRTLARDGSIGYRQGRKYRFQFSDLILARTAQQLLREKCSMSAVRTALRKFKASAHGSNRLRAEGRDIVTDYEGALFSVVTGQGVLDFSLQSIVSNLAPKVIRLTAASPQATAEDWFDVGCDLDSAGALEQAMEAYERAINDDPRFADAHVNLGRLYAVKGDRKSADRHYRHAVSLEPENALAWFNWGVMHQGLGRLEDAIGAYRTAVRLDPEFADAHYNLAAVLEPIDRRSAFRHLSTYKRLSLVR